MGNSGNSPKDLWDKLDALGKFLSAVVLALIALFIKMGSDDIANSMRTGELARNLLNDLTKREEKIRQDIALITLNRAIGDQNPGLIIDIAENIFYANKEFGDLQGNVAFKIIEERNKAKAEEIRKKTTALTENPGLRKDLRSSPDIAQATRDKALQQAPQQAQLIAQVYSSVVYIQYQDRANKALIEELRKNFQDQGLYAPGIENVVADYGNSIRFFHKEDRGAAEQTAELVKQFFHEKGYQKDFKIEDYSSKFKVPKGQVEVWINLARP